MNPRVTAVKPLENYLLFVEFNNAEQRQMDMQPYLAFAVFAPLIELGFFSAVQADHGTLCWPGGIDIDPDSVYLESVPIKQAATA